MCSMGVSSCNVQIFHIAETTAWAARTEVYVTADLESEGFIHCSLDTQLDQVASNFYGGRDDLVLLTIDAGAIGKSLVYEDLYDLGEDFPHVYGPIPVSAVINSAPFSVS